MTLQPLKSVCVYCGSRTGTNPVYTREATELGKGLAERGLDLVYGAGSIGLMGLVARASVDAGGRVIGIIPDHLDAVEITQGGLAEIHVTSSMHERKKMMFDRSDAFLVLPGGLGTLDELFEIVTWAQLGLHRKPIILVNSGGYWDALVTLVKSIVTEGFAKPAHADLITVTASASEALVHLDSVAMVEGEGLTELI